ncbi:alpha/beta hydrolase-fold protein [Leucobacter allii]|uniref:enterochelin esterase domain-containing protein n=1 Tax=Leucobacter allii TaxID=2932247 RepID=UPI001FD488B1|nr:alpha/beta hydrolase-fold protein [Leucobacter allii]UOR00348.1 alpha/beta hydrolase-fold protein [Leucobacter allii]
MHRHDATMDRVVGPLESAWATADAPERRRLAAEALARSNPRIDPDPAAPGVAIWSWTVEAADAQAVLLWTNPVFDHERPATAELARLADSGLWTIALRLPRALRMSYRIACWRDAGPPPWRTAEGRRATVLAAIGAADADPRGRETARGSVGEAFSIAAGPDAPGAPWEERAAADADVPVPTVDELALPGGGRAWVHRPLGAERIGSDARPTPLLVLFDGQVWLDGLGLPRIIDRLTASGALPPLHIALLDSGSLERRWERLGVPHGQVDEVLDELLPALRRDYPVSRERGDTIVSGQSLGGIAALWTLALGAGEVGHAISQSPSLWRFPVLGPLLREPRWDSIALEAGVYEPGMRADAAELAEALRTAAEVGAESPEDAASRRAVSFSAPVAGHDWAAWRVGLVRALIAHFA